MIRCRHCPSAGFRNETEFLNYARPPSLLQRVLFTRIAFNQEGDDCSRYAKDYDAIVTLRDRSARSRFALEYERSPKSLRDYAKIRQAIKREDQVDVFLYLVPNHHLLSFVGECFSGTR